ncbi:MAG: SDR family NAD(P)-dependent oxidoreductase, partial [Abditibacteriota bacterium]|nr:SDR family NAD(P)-dependent oxidoreductase [Abditibacteriota bacterium]
MLKDKTALITGGGRGVGREVALRLAAEGVKVFIVSRTESELKAVKEEITAKGGVCEYAICDMTDEDSLKAAAEAATGAFGGVDILVNNAGMQK